MLRHRGDEFGERTAKNTIVALTQVHIAFVTCEISDPLPELDDFNAVLVCTERLDQAIEGLANSLESFVTAGGGLVVLHRGLSDNFCGLFGIVSQDRSAALVSSFQAGGLVFPSRVLPSFQGLILDPSVIDGHASFDVVPSAHACVVATTSTGKPLAWRTQFGNGFVLFWNTTICSERRMRGLIIESLESVVRISVVPVANAGVVQVDDFPAPLPAPSADLGGSAKVDEFYSHIWWPDVYRLAKGYDIALTCFVAFDYSNVVEEAAMPQPQPGLVKIDPAITAAIGRLPPAEIGLHGYNHLPFTVENWPNQAAMERSIERAKVEWDAAGLGALPASYVPPMNMYDRTGVAALVAGLPGIKSISSVLNSAREVATQQDFGPEPWNNALFCLPRATCGHESSPQLFFDCANQVAALGVWTHFMHPDDLTDVPGPGRTQEAARNPNGRPWRRRHGKPGLYDQLARMFAQVKSQFPWLVFRSTSDAADILKQFFESEWKVNITVDQVVVNGPVGSFFRLRTNGSPRVHIASCEGASIVHNEMADDYCLYVIEIQANRVDILLQTETPPQGIFERLLTLLRPDKLVSTA